MLQMRSLTRCSLRDVRPFIRNHSARSLLNPESSKHDNRMIASSCRRSLLCQSPKRLFSASSALSRASQSGAQDAEVPGQASQTRRQGRAPSGKTSLRRVAVEAQRSRDGMLSDRGVSKDLFPRPNRVRAYCAAEQYNIATAIRILEKEGYTIDPYETRLLPQVVHIQMPIPRSKDQETGQQAQEELGDVFIFPSGTVVTWSLPEAATTAMVGRTLLAAAQNSLLGQIESEDMEFVEDSQRENSSIKGDTIIVGTSLKALEDYHGSDGPEGSRKSNMESAQQLETESRRGKVDTTLAKIAFSSGLARSTKLAVLESLLSNYFESTRSIPTMLSRGSRLPFTRSFILRKTGQLLSVRAQLNLYSELTDSLPDLFWDSRHDLGLEGYYDQVGRALDVGVRIKVLNEKMDYAQEIASVLRERLSEKHGLVLEWMIIALITIEVGFEVLRLWKERDRTHEKEPN